MVSTYSFVGDLKFGCSPAAGCARLMEGRRESFKEARRACTGAVITFARTVYVCMYVWSSHIAEYGSIG